MIQITESVLDTMLDEIKEIERIEKITDNELKLKELKAFKTKFNYFSYSLNRLIFITESLIKFDKQNEGLKNEKN